MQIHQLKGNKITINGYKTDDSHKSFKVAFFKFYFHMQLDNIARSQCYRIFTLFWSLPSLF